MVGKSNLEFVLFPLSFVTETSQKMKSLVRLLLVSGDHLSMIFKVCILAPVLVERGEKVEKKKKPEE